MYIFFNLQENFENINSNFDCSNSQITIAVTNSDATTSVSILSVSTFKKNKFQFYIF